jgi:hypothetical protein
MGPPRESCIRPSRRRILAMPVTAAPALAAVQVARGQPTPAGEVVVAWHVTIAPTWFDPPTAPPRITPFGMLHALHERVMLAPIMDCRTLRDVGPRVAEHMLDSMPLIPLPATRTSGSRASET